MAQASGLGRQSVDVVKASLLRYQREVERRRPMPVIVGTSLQFLLFALLYCILCHEGKTAYFMREST
jgi:hypothetical protein